MTRHSSDRHTPTQAFRDRLEQELVTEFAQSRTLPRAARRRPPVAPAVRQRVQQLRTAALVIVALGVGALAGAAYGQVQDGRERSSLLQVAQLELQAAQRHEELARQHHEQVRRRFETGIVQRDALVAAETSLSVAQATRRRIELNMAEIELRSAMPRDDLGAPLVRGRDFVRERLLVELGSAQARLSAAQRLTAELTRRHDLGLVAALAVLEARQEQRQFEAAVAILAGRLDLREQFVQGALSYAAVAERARLLELDQAIRVAEDRHELAAARLEHVREQHRLGLADRVHLLRAELDETEKRAELERYRAQRAAGAPPPRQSPG